jgi:glycolate oxidase FAD binding subunit
MLDEQASSTLWRRVRDVTPFSAYGPRGEWPLWRVSVAPSAASEFARLIGGDAEMLYDWAGGLVWVALPPSDDAGAALVRRTVTMVGGHATLVRAPASVRAAVEVFEPQEAAVAALTRRVKEGFDPQGILNPGRMWAGV